MRLLSGANRKWLIASAVPSYDYPLTASSLKQQHDVCASIRVRGASMCKAAATQATPKRKKTTTREHAVGDTHVARFQPSDTAGTSRLGVMQGGIVLPLRVGHYLYVHGVVSSRATAIRPNTVCDLLATNT